MTREIMTDLYEGNLARQADYRGYGEAAYGGRVRAGQEEAAYGERAGRERRNCVGRSGGTERRTAYGEGRCTERTGSGKGRVAWKEPVYEGQKNAGRNRRQQSGAGSGSACRGQKARRRKKKALQRKIVRGLLFYFLIAGVIATCIAICGIFGGHGEKSRAEEAMKESAESAAGEAAGENAEELYGENGEGAFLEVTPEIRQECQDLYAGYSELLTLVNKEHELPASCQLSLRSICKGRLEAADVLYDDLCALLEAGGDAGYQYWIASAHRDRSYQQGLVDEDVEKYMAKGYSYEAALRKTYEYTMPAGYSEHETGLALDILCSTNTMMDESQAGEPGNRWLAEHCHEYGFILRYPADKEDVTGIAYEPWHFRYVGREAAAYLKEKGWTLEEFYEVVSSEG